MTPFEIGTDLSASIRIPSAYCGIFGLKPTERRVSLDGVVPDPRGTPRSIRLMACVGPMARTVVIPYKSDQDGLPIGVQLVGKRWDESRLLGIAKAVTAVTGEFRRPPGY